MLWARILQSGKRVSWRKKIAEKCVVFFHESSLCKIISTYVFFGAGARKKNLKIMWAGPAQIKICVKVSCTVYSL